MTLRVTPALALAVAGVVAVVIASQPSLGARQLPPAAADSGWTTAQDHQHMMAQLGIRKLRPGPSGNESAPNAANYDEAMANPFPNLPEVADAEERPRRSRTARCWWNAASPRDRRGVRPRGAGPRAANVPDGDVDGRPTTDQRHDRAHAGRRQAARRPRRQQRRYPAINVDIQMTLVTPANASGPVPGDDHVRRRRAATGVSAGSGAAACAWRRGPQARRRRRPPATRRRPSS